MNRHAYLIIAHNRLEMLKKLVAAIDDSRNDIFVHIDAKAPYDGRELRTEYSKLTVVQPRIDARWGDFSLVEVEFALLKEALKREEYSYLHLISGVDYPIKSQDYIHRYCAEHQGTEYVGLAQNVTREELGHRTQHYFPFSRQFNSTNMAIKVLRIIAVKLQSLVRYRRTTMPVSKGCQWWSITDNFARYILSNVEMLRRDFNHTYCPDEMAIQTLFWNSPFSEKAFSRTDEFDGCKRFIPWENGELRPLDEKQFEAMKASDAWFARKFTSETLSAFLESTSS